MSIDSDERRLEAATMNTMTNTRDAKSSRASRSGLSASAPPRVLVPNAATLAAMRSAERKAAGLEHDDSPVFSLVDDAMSYLEA